MRSTLQHLYSISVFIGVLITAYLFMSREESTRIFYPQLSEKYEDQVSIQSPALIQMLEVETQLKSFNSSQAKEDLQREITLKEEQKNLTRTVR